MDVRTEADLLASSTAADTLEKPPVVITAPTTQPAAKQTPHDAKLRGRTLRQSGDPKQKHSTRKRNASRFPPVRHVPPTL